MKKIISLLVGLALIMSACTPGEDPKDEPVNSPVQGKKVAYIVNMPDSDIFTLFALGAQETAEKLGMTCNCMYTDGDNETFNQLVNQFFADPEYSGLIISHMSNAYATLTNLLAKYPDKKVVVFDSEFKDESGAPAKIEGVTQLFQDDQSMAALLLDFLVDNYQMEKTKPLRVLKIWKGPNYLAAFDRRDSAYVDYEKDGLIRTIATLPVEQISLDDEEEVKLEVAKFLDNGGEDQIDAIWCAYDAYAQGCYKALIANEVNIPMVSVDLSNRDILAMRHAGSPWRASACTDFKANGEQALRILALEINNQYDRIIVPSSGGEAVDYIEMPGSLIDSRALTPNTTLETVEEIAPASYGDKTWLVTDKWMFDLIGY